jgi:hypothetical protein
VTPGHRRQVEGELGLARAAVSMAQRTVSRVGGDDGEPRRRGMELMHVVSRAGTAGLWGHHLWWLGASSRFDFGRRARSCTWNAGPKSEWDTPGGAAEGQLRGFALGDALELGGDSRLLEPPSATPRVSS